MEAPVTLFVKGTVIEDGVCVVKDGIYCLHSTAGTSPGYLAWVSPSQICDGVAQCRDGSDEVNCKGLKL